MKQQIFIGISLPIEKIYLNKEKELDLVTWSHWEIVGGQTVEHAPQLNDSRAMEFQKGIPIKYTTFCKVANGALVNFTATNVVTHQVSLLTSCFL